MTVGVGEANWHVDFAFWSPKPQIGLKKYTNGDDADIPTGPTVDEDSVVTWTYVLTNTGNVTLTNVTLVDDPEGSVTCPQSELVPSAAMLCVLTGIAQAGQYTNTAIVTGTPTLGPVTPVTATNPSHYLGLTAGLGDRVWYDDDRNGVQDLGEASVPSVTVQLLRNGSVLSTTTTNASGYYSFTNLAPGLYSVRFVISSLPSGYELTVQNAGSNNAANSDANQITGQTGLITLVGNQYDPTWDAGIWRAQPSIVLKKYTNGYDADTPTGPYVGAGQPVTWTYNITNTGNVTLTNMILVDNVEGTITCTPTMLAPGANTSCTQTNSAQIGQYANTAVVTGTPMFGPVTSVTSTNPSHYFGAEPKLVLKKYTNGWDADTVPGPQVNPGSVVTWTYIVTNTGNVALNIAPGDLQDDKVGTINTSAFQLQPGERRTLSKQGIALAGQYTNTSVITATPIITQPVEPPIYPPPLPPVTPITDTDPSHYYGVTPAITLKKYTNGYDADTITGPSIKTGGVVTWTYVITNSGDITLTNVTLTDDKVGNITCPVTSLAPNATTICTRAGIASAGQYTNTASVIGTNILSATQQVTSTNPSHYFGVQPAIAVRKYTNGEDADTIPGPQVIVGSVVTWTYVITNTGNIALNSVSLTDDKVGGITCPVGSLTPGAMTTCTQTGIAQLSQYTNTAVVMGTPVLSPVTPPDLPNFPPATPPTTPVTDTNPSHYYGVGLSLGNRLWVDNGGGIPTNRNNGRYDSDEPAVPQGVVVELLGITNTVLLTTTTDGNGYYRFDNLPAGLYQVRIPASEFTAGGQLYGYASSTGQTTTFTMVDNNLDHGDDAEVNGVKSAIVTLGATNPTGDVDNGAIGAGSHGPEGDSHDNLTVDFGFVPQATFGNFVWLESDTDGDATTGTITPIGGIVITATSTSGEVYVMTTDVAGYYTFTVPIDTYTVTYGPVPGGYGTVVSSATPNSGSADKNNPGTDQQSRPNNTVVTLIAGDNIPTIDFGFHTPPAQFGDRVWLESDTDGIASTGVITPVTGMVMTATAGTHIYTTTTDANGYYSFTLPAGAYTVTYGTVPASYGVTTPSSTPGGKTEAGNAGTYSETGKPDQSHSNGTTVTVAPGEANWHIDFGFHNLVQIGNRLWIENDIDGNAATGTVTPIVGQVVTATSSTGAVYTATTNTNGLYTITVPANAVYTITTGTPAGTIPSTVIATMGNNANAAANDNKNHVNTGTPVIVTTLDNFSIDFGFHVPSVQFGDRVWLESDTDGLASTGTITPVVGMSIIATDASGVTHTTSTNALGYYSFTLPVGTYTVTYGTIPASYGVTTPSSTPGGNSEAGNAGTYNETGKPDQSHANGTTVTLIDGQANWHVDFAFWLPQPTIHLKKYTNDDDADTPTGPLVTMGSVVTWTYNMTNTGNVTLTNLTLVDDKEGGITCPQASLAPGVSMICILNGIAQAGQYTNTAVVTGTPTLGLMTPVTATNPSHYYGVIPAIVVKKYTNGYDADTLTGPYIQAGDTVTWTYIITNTGEITLTNVTLTDDKVGAITCSVSTLNPGATTTCTQTGVATVGQYTNTASVIGTNILSPTQQVTSTNPSHYFGAQPAILLRKYTNGDDADTLPGPQVIVGSVVTWTYIMTNTGNVTLTNLTLTDDKVGGITCLVVSLVPGATTTCIKTGIAELGQYTNTAVVTGTPSLPPVTPPDLPIFPPATPPTTPVTATNPSHYNAVGLSLGNRLWIDDGAGTAANRNNGVYDIGETATPQGVVVELLDITSTVRFTTTTDSNGYYRFDNLTAGQYQVRIPATEFATGGKLYGYASSTGQTPTFGASDNNHDHGDDTLMDGVTSGLITLNATNPTSDADNGATGAGTNGPVGDGYDNLTVDFGFVPLATFGNFVWIESDQDGDASTGTITPVVSQVITATDGNGQVYTTTTNALGYYSFTVPSGLYTVTYGVPPTGTVPSATPNSGTANQANQGTDQQSRPNNTVITLVAGDNIPTIDFGFHVPLAQFGDRVWLESDTDGLASTGVITPVAGMVITAMDSNGVAHTTTTNALGYYSFTVSVGTYTVTYGAMPASYGLTTPSSTPGGSSEVGNAGLYAENGKPDQSHINGTTVTVTDGQANWHVDFAFHNLVRIGNRLWVEDDTDGDATTGAVTPVVGQVVTATSSTGVVYTTTTDANGLYTITVPANDTYTVTTGTPTGTTPSFFNGTPGNDQGHTATGTLVTLGSTDDLTIDFGFHMPLTPTNTPTSMPTDTPTNVPTDTPTAIPTNTPTDTPTNVPTGTPTSVPTNTPTDTPTNVPTSTPTDTPTGPPTNTPTATPTFTPTSTSAVEPPVTVVSTPTGIPATFGNFVWIELDNDGDATTGVSIPVAGMVLTATSSTGQVYTTVTNSQGYYSFTVPAGVYTVTYGLPPDNTVPSETPNSNTADHNNMGFDQQSRPNHTVVTLAPGDNIPTIDFGFYKEPSALGEEPEPLAPGNKIYLPWISR